MICPRMTRAVVNHEATVSATTIVQKFTVLKMASVMIELPDEVYESLRRSPSEVQRDLRLAAAIRWYSQGLISQERAAMAAGMDRTDFLMALAREQVDAFHVDLDQLAREIAGE